MKLSELIESMQILLKYEDVDCPLIIEDEYEIKINKINPEQISEIDRIRLEELGWHIAIKGEQIYPDFLFFSNSHSHLLWCESYIYCIV